MKAWIAVSVLSLLIACPARTAIASADGQVTSASKDLCKDLAKIKSVPFHDGWPESDPAYLQLSENREAAKACLLDRITDATPMRDPRSEPTKIDGFAVGDLAFFLLVDFKMVSFDEVLPAGVKAELAERGVFAYFEWVQRPASRQMLQEACRKWGRAHSSPKGGG